MTDARPPADVHEAVIRAALSWCEETPNGESHREKALTALAALTEQLQQADDHCERASSAMTHWLGEANREKARAERAEKALRRIADETHPGTPVNFREAIRIAREALAATERWHYWLGLPRSGQGRDEGVR